MPRLPQVSAACVKVMVPEWNGLLCKGPRAGRVGVVLSTIQNLPWNQAWVIAAHASNCSMLPVCFTAGYLAGLAAAVEQALLQLITGAGRSRSTSTATGRKTTTATNRVHAHLSQRPGFVEICSPPMPGPALLSGACSGASQFQPWHCARFGVSPAVPTAHADICTFC